MLQIRKKIKADNPHLSNEDFHEMVLDEYAKVARFKGAVIRMSKEGQAEVTNTFLKKINVLNIDILAQLKSSNPCERFFSVLTKWTEGKRRYLGRKDQLFAVVGIAAAQQSHANIEDRLLLDLQLETNHTRDKMNKQMKAQKARNSLAKKLPRNLLRRKLAKQLKLHKMAKDDKSPKRHKSGKMNPKNAHRTTVEDAKAILADSSSTKCPNTQTEKSKKRRSASLRKCSNCRVSGHNKKNCTEPRYHESDPKKKGADEWDELLES
jgi:hypothetical protein